MDNQLLTKTPKKPVLSRVAHTFIYIAHVREYSPHPPQALVLNKSCKAARLTLKSFPSPKDLYVFVNAFVVQ